MTLSKFYQLNSTKLKIAFKFTSIAFSVIAFILLTISYFNNQLPDIPLFIAIIFTSSIGLPLLLIFIIVIITYLKIIYKTKILSKTDSIKNNRIQITDILLHEDTNLTFTNVGKKAVIDNNFEVIYSMNDLSLDIVDLHLKIFVDENDKRVKLLKDQKLLKEDNIILNPYFDLITKTYKTKVFRKFDSSKIEKELLYFVDKIKSQYL